VKYLKEVLTALYKSLDYAQCNNKEDAVREINKLINEVEQQLKGE